MKIQHWVSGIAIAAIVAVTMAVLFGWSSLDSLSSSTMDNSLDEHDDNHGDDHAGEAFERGPHGGRLLEDGTFALEIVVFESGIPPEFHVYAFDDGEPLAPERFSARISLSRLGGVRDTFEFEPEMDYRRGLGVVREPHSFDVDVAAEYGGRNFAWVYESHEGRTQIPARVSAAQGVVSEPAGAATLRDIIELTGTVQTDPGRVSQVRARFAGIVTDVRRTVGDVVTRGETLAMVETNESLRSVEITAPIAGLIVDRNIQSGQPTGNEPLYVIADLSEVWINLDVFGTDIERIATGQTARIETLGGVEVIDSIDWVSPLVAHGSQSVRARVTAANSDAVLRPGQFVRASIVTAQYEVPLAVERSALQTFRDFDVVFAHVGDVYEVRMLELGRSDAQFVEVLDGLNVGEVYVTQNSYLIKADIEKSGASHDH